jgi:hypothetical protein
MGGQQISDQSDQQKQSFWVNYLFVRYRYLIFIR